MSERSSLPKSSPPCLLSLGNLDWAALAPATDEQEMEQYREKPVAYIRDVLRLTLTPKQAYLAELLLHPPHKVLVRASHSCGKTFLAAALISWFFDTRPVDSAVISTAPTARDVRDLLWTEVRKQRRAAGLPDSFVGGKAPEMWTSEDHFAKGFTADRGESFQGRHFRHMLFVFDECVGVDPVFWETTESMFRQGGEHFWFAICNPTDTSSQAYQEEQLTDLEGKPSWHTVSMAAIHHPNIKAQLAGQPPPYPSAVTLEQFESWVAKWTDKILPGELDSEQGDFQWPPDSGQFFRPGPIFESRALGRWPRQGTYGVWSEHAWNKATAPCRVIYDPKIVPTIGVDLASFGDDYTEFHVRWGVYSLHHERHNGWLEEQTANRLKELCAEWAARTTASRPAQRAPCRPEEIPLHYDADGRGGSLVNFGHGYNWIPIRASAVAREPMRYPNRRSELWFNTVQLAREGLVCLGTGLLSRDVLALLRQQAMAPKWAPDSAGRQAVEPKKETKKRLGYSPDGMDAVNLAYYAYGAFEAPSSAPGAPRPEEPHGIRYGVNTADRVRRGGRLFGRGE